MQKAKKIAAIFFLGLFGLMMLHQAFPHLHHQHEDSHSYSDLAHPAEHHHHDDSSAETDSSLYGFFGIFMEMHVHSTVSSDLVVLRRHTTEWQTPAFKDVAGNALYIRSLYLTDKKQNSKPPVYHPPNNYFNPCLSHLGLRGPPAIG